jgi:hypothetical protein
MNNCDTIILDCLTNHAGFTAHQIGHLKSWWESLRLDSEGLGQFLHRQELLSESAVHIFAQMGHDHIGVRLGVALLDRNELQTLRHRLPDATDFGRDALGATVTLFNGDDTAKDSTPAVSLPPAEPEVPHIGASLGKYCLLEWIGQGSSGVVFRALHPTLQIPVAVKILLATSNLQGAQLHYRLRAEARMLAMLNHPNIVRVFDFDHDEKSAFLVLEFVNGPSLAELIDQSGRVQSLRVVSMMKQLAAALAATHKLGIIHRDIKPANVLLTRQGDAKLADLGLALAPAGGMRAWGANSRVGSVSYMAPELAGSARAADERSDIYALGATLYHALTGQPPFVGETVWQVLAHHAKSPIPAPRSKAADVPATLSDLIIRMLAKDAALRPASFAELLEEPALRSPECNAAESSLDSPSEQSRPRWRSMFKSWLYRPADRQCANLSQIK